MLYATDYNFEVDDVESWMWDRAAERSGYWTISLPIRNDSKKWLKSSAWWLLPVAGICAADFRSTLKAKWKPLALALVAAARYLYERYDYVVWRNVNYTQKEFALLDKVITNQAYSESKSKIARTVVYQRSLQLWDTGMDDDVTMRVLGAWAMSQYKCQAGKFYGKNTFWLGLFGKLAHQFRPRLSKTISPEITNSNVSPQDEDSGDALEKKSPKNKLGYQKAGAEYINEHEGGGNDDKDTEIRATVDGRVIHKECGVGVVGQTTDDKGRKQVVGVLSQPISVEPNVYAQEALNAIKAIEERIKKKQRPYAGSKEDELKIKRMVWQSINGKKNAPFSAKKVLDLIHELIYEKIKSGKWTDSRVQETIEGLCREIEPTFRLKGAVKLESMPEEKAPRLLIADEDRGQVMALMSIYCIESLIKKHFPEKGIKGLPKKEAIKRVMKACKVPRKAAKELVSIFEGDGSAWDTTCSAKIRGLVENPVIHHVANLVNGFMYATPHTWAEAHASVCAQEKLDISYTKNKEFQKLTIDAIRRSGHRGTSCLNWWMNYVCWHCAVFQDPEDFLDPAHRYGIDVTGQKRWFNSAFEGDDSFLVTAPKIQEGKELHMAILQFWERIGFNMKIAIRKSRALFVGYYVGLDDAGPVFNEEKNEWMMVPEIDRCFARAGTSCSPSMIEAFNANDRKKCVRLAGSAAMSRAFEFAGLAPTVSEKFLNYAIDCDFEITHDLKMRTDSCFDDKSELVDHIRALNATCTCEDKILLHTGFWCSDEDKNKFTDFMWDYEQLIKWEDFRESLPESWRQGATAN